LERPELRIEIDRRIDAVMEFGMTAKIVVGDDEANLREDGRF
jgi:hypothetical protein